MKQKAQVTPLRRLCRWGGGILLAWALCPLVNGILGVGVLVPALVALFLLWWGWRTTETEETWKKGWRRKMVTAVCILAAVVAAVGVLITTLMVTSALRKPQEGATVIVLGSKIYGDQPSRMMRQRLDAATKRLEQDPTAHCVVSGGLGEGETYTEAYVMKKYLVEKKGISPDRIACEEKSTDTHENLHLSLDIIREKEWSTHVVTATQVFHQYRAARLAKMAGADSVGGAACLSPLHLALNYWVRECAAIFRLWLTGY